jgi:hypothetical protein
MDIKTVELVHRLEKHPHLKDRIEALLNIAENKSGDLIRADDAEEQLIIEVRKMGNELLQAWAVSQAQKQTAVYCEHEDLIAHSKKNCIGNRPLDR